MALGNSNDTGLSDQRCQGCSIQVACDIVGFLKSFSQILAEVSI